MLMSLAMTSYKPLPLFCVILPTAVILKITLGATIYYFFSNVKFVKGKEKDNYIGGKEICGVLFINYWPEAQTNLFMSGIIYQLSVTLSLISIFCNSGYMVVLNVVSICLI